MQTEETKNSPLVKRLNASPAIIWTTSANGACTFLSERWYDFTGQQESEALGFGWLKATHPEDEAHAEEIFRQANSKQIPFVIQYRLRNKEGHYRWVIDSGNPVFSDTQAFEGFAGTVIDIDEQKTQIDLARAKTVSTLSSIPLSVSVLEGPEFRYSFVNTAHGAFFGGSQDLIGKTVRDSVAASSSRDIIEKLERVYQTGLEHKDHEMPLTLIQKNGTEKKFYIDLTFNPLKLEDGSIFGVVSTAQDVTERVILNREINQQRDRAVKAESLLNQAVSLAKIGFYDWDIKNDRFSLSEQFKLDWGLEDGASLDDAFQLIIPEDRERVQKLIDQSIQNHTPYRAEYRIKKKNHAVVWLEVQGSVSYDVDGKPAQFFGTSLNISARKEIEIRLANERSQLDQIFEKSPAGMAIWVGENLIFDRVNPDYQKIFPDRELLGRPFLEACPELHGQGFDDLLRDVMRTGKPFVGHEVLAKISPTLGAEPEDRYYNFSYLPVYNSKGEAFAVYDHAVDVTDAVMAKREIINARKTADLANQSKSQFLANMSHEIRSPLGAIIGFSDLLRTPNLAPAEIENYLNVVDRNSKHLLRVVDDILDLSKVEAGMLLVEEIEFSLVEILSDFASLMAFKAREKGIQFAVRFDTALPNPVISDPTRLRQILTNIVANAIKFTHKGRVQLTVSYENSELQMKVSDTGLGITAEQAKRLFVPFQQADATTTRKFGGTGLGLVLTRKLTESMGGYFRLEKSKEGIGSTFVAAIKIQVPETAQLIHALEEQLVQKSLETRTIQKKLLSGVKILLIEDSLDNQVLITLYLSREGAIVEVASNGQQGIEMAQTNDFDILLCDLQMPTKDGYETVKELRLQGYEIPIIALTAHAMKEEYSKAMALGFSEYLTKPINKAELFEAILRLK